MKLYQLTMFIILVAGCQPKCNDKDGVEQMNDIEIEREPIELNPQLVKDFYIRPGGTEDKFVKTTILKADLDENGKEDLIVLCRLQDFGGDPGDFHRITIELDNGIEWTETNLDGWVRFDNNYTVPDPIEKLNQIDTDLLLLTDFGNAKIIGLFGWVYASEPGLLTIIEFSSGQPRIMINQQLDLVSLDSTRIRTKFFDDACWTEIKNNKLIMTCE